MTLTPAPLQTPPTHPCDATFVEKQKNAKTGLYKNNRISDCIPLDAMDPKNTGRQNDKKTVVVVVFAPTRRVVSRPLSSVDLSISASCRLYIHMLRILVSPSLIFLSRISLRCY